ncbi:MAG: hypothetical protein JO235_15745 [Chroococcidiopsidaceae cyanobacterium CP_BM_RX_35]|nr:hypothetical protein [Chroococcidiopsidaceae cyanobacterium CP_BM_RX_35]
MDSDYVLQLVERYQKVASQQERNDLLYQIAFSSQIFTTREMGQIAERGGKLSEQQRQLLLGFLEVYFNLDWGGI